MADRRFIGLLPLAVLAGVMQALALATPWDGQASGTLQVLGMALWLWGLQRCTRGAHAALLGWLFGTGWLSATFWWLYTSLHTYGGLHALLAALSVLALAGTLSLYPMAAGWLYHGLYRRAGRTRVLAFAALWLLVELARAQCFTGFPWGTVGYAHVDSPLALLAPYVGVYGISAAAAGLAAALVWAGRLRLPLRKAGVLKGFALGLLLPLLAFQAITTEHAQRSGRFSVSLLQGQIAQEEKFQAHTGIAQALDWYRGQLLASTSAVTVTPETALPVLPQQLPEGYWQELQAHFARTSRVALIGLPLGQYSEGYTNSARALGAAVADYRYDKHHLVPFGEFIPPLFRWFTELLHIPLGDFQRGAVAQASLPVQEQWLAPTICFEDLFGEELAARFADPERAPTAFVNMSNLGWFGAGLAIDQHLQISRLRALEFERPVLRATNTGATAVIDHRGRVTHSLPRQAKGVLVAEVEGRRGLTPYARWTAQFGLLPLWLLALLGLLVALLQQKWRRLTQSGATLDVHP